MELHKFNRMSFVCVPEIFFSDSPTSTPSSKVQEKM